MGELPRVEGNPDILIQDSIPQRNSRSFVMSFESFHELFVSVVYGLPFTQTINHTSRHPSNPHKASVSSVAPSLHLPIRHICSPSFVYHSVFFQFTRSCTANSHHQFKDKPMFSQIPPVSPNYLPSGPLDLFRGLVSIQLSKHEDSNRIPWPCLSNPDGLLCQH